MNKKKIIRTTLIIFLIMIVGAAIVGYRFYDKIFQPNVNIEDNKSTYLYIPSGSGFEEVMKSIINQDILEDPSSFRWLAIKKNYHNHIHAGRYLISDKMNNNELVNLLRSGKQAPVKVTFHNIRNDAQLAGALAEQLEADSAAILERLKDDAYMEKFGFSNETARLMFIPNTYEFFWDTSADELFKRMHREYNAFWTEKRIKKAEEAGLSPVKASILASIVQLETSKQDEMARIAGVYINRLKRGMALQADPTVIYAMGDFTIKRVLKRHLEYDSPYNTYKYPGLPPGPIYLPSPVTINKVLDYEKHNYLYFCAKPDFSGYHNFAKTLTQHNINARRYQRALNRNGIR